MTYRLKRGEQVPLGETGGLPGDFFGALSNVLWRWSLTGLALALLLCFADFTHSIADTGMDFVSVNEVGHMEPVLIISKEKRNTKRPYETAVDPFLTRTDPDFLVRNKTVAEHLLNNDTESVIESRRQSQLTESYLTAVSLIARMVFALPLSLPMSRQRVSKLHFFLFLASELTMSLETTHCAR